MQVTFDLYIKCCNTSWQVFSKITGPAMPFESPVAFTAALSQTFAGGDGYDVVPFDVSILNYGGHFR